MFTFFKNLPMIYMALSKLSEELEIRENYNLRLEGCLCSLGCWNDPEWGDWGQGGAHGLFFQTDLDLGQLGGMLVPARGRLVWDFKQEQSVYISYWKDNVLFLRYLKRETPKPFGETTRGPTCGSPRCTKWDALIGTWARRDTFLECVHQAPLPPRVCSLSGEKALLQLFDLCCVLTLIFHQTPILFENWELRKYSDA